MKLQINGFDIEVNTEESNMTVKVLDANGKELSNNTYTQSATPGEEITPVDMPSAEDTATTEPATDAPAEGTEGETPAEGTEGETPAEGTEGETPTESTEEPAVGESFIPDFETFKKMRKENKI
jgi:hypothetical protein